MAHAQPAPQKPNILDSTVYKVLWLVIFAWVVALIPLGFISLGVDVERDLRWAKCHVTEATADETQAGWRITFEATNCPRLIYTDGLTEDNAEPLATTIEPGPYEVRLHESAIHPDGHVRSAEEVTLHSYRPAPAGGNIDAPTGF